MKPEEKTSSAQIIGITSVIFILSAGVSLVFVESVDGIWVPILFAVLGAVLGVISIAIDGLSITWRE